MALPENAWPYQWHYHWPDLIHNKIYYKYYSIYNQWYYLPGKRHAKDAVLFRRVERERLSTYLNLHFIIDLGLELTRT